MGCCINKYQISNNSIEIFNQVINIVESISQSEVKSLFRTRNKDIKSKETQADEWRTTIEKLCQNESLINYARAKPRFEFERASQVGAYLSACKYARSELEKAWLAYVWVTHNIDYDLKNYLANIFYESNLECVLESGVAVCEGYALLFRTLCTTYLGVKCYEVVGSSKGCTYRIGSNSGEIDCKHAWNVIYCDQQWMHVDSTWGAGHIDHNR